MTAPQLPPGSQIAGRYTVHGVLGNGGAVITYHCVDPQGQEVAVKLFDPQIASHAAIMQSLEQAYATTNALPPGSSAPILDAGYDPVTVAPFSVVAVLRIPSLAAMGRRLSPEETVALLRGVAQSLDLAHVRGVVHGALKPTNVFVGPSQNPVTISDFGSNLAKAVVPTQEGFVGSAPWIAPEQAQSGSVTPAADVFAAGLLAFFALTGRSYWRTCQGPNFDVNAWQQELGASRAPASARAAELGVALSPVLDLVLWKALAADPNERHRSVGELANALEEVLRIPAAGGGQSTMALPMILGDAPSPLPRDMRNPERAPGLGTANTMALTADQLAPPPGMGGQGVPPQGMPAPGMGDYGGYGAPPAGQGLGGSGIHGVPPGMPGAPGLDGAGGPSPNYGGPPGMGSYAPTPDPGYPPAPSSKRKVFMIAGGMAAALALVVGGVLVYRSLDANAKPDSKDPVAVPAATATTEPTAEPSSAPTAEASAEPAPTASASAAPVAKVTVTIRCVPDCDTVKVDGVEVPHNKPTELEVGDRSLELSRKDYTPLTETLKLAAGAAPSTKSFTLKREPVASNTPTPTTKPSGGGSTTKPSGGGTTKPSGGGTTKPSGGGSTTKPSGGGKNCKTIGFVKKC